MHTWRWAIRKTPAGIRNATQTNFNTKVARSPFQLRSHHLRSQYGFRRIGQSIRTIHQEISNSANIDKAYDYLSTVYLTSKNYSAAYQSVSNIKTLTPKLRETKQYLEYQLGTESFAESNYQRAIEFFTKAIQSAPLADTWPTAISGGAKAITCNRDYVRSVSDLNSFFSQPNVIGNQTILGTLCAWICLVQPEEIQRIALIVSEIRE